jgi:membrane dipeptidase
MKGQGMSNFDTRAERATRVHAESIVIDGLEICRWDSEMFRRLRQGGLTAVVATVATLESFRATVGNIAEWYRMFDQHRSLIMPVRTVYDITQAKQMGKVGIIFGFQNTSPIEDDLHLLAVFKELGVRVIQLTYMERNLVGDGCLERTDCGLSRFGLEVIEEMNRLGILIDLSHAGYRTTMEAIEVSQKPVAFTHANPRALCDHPRNKTDEQIKALVQKGGVIGATIFPPYLAAGSRATIEDVVDVIDYLVGIAGIDHVGIGTDFTEGQPRKWFDWLLRGKSRKGPAMELQYPIVNPEGIQSVADFPNITRALLARGYADSDVKKIIGGNWLRLFEEVWP